MIAYKLFTKRKDGSLGSLFINRKARLPLDKWMEAEDYPTKGYAHRPGWHAAHTPNAPHLSMKGRVWAEVEIEDCKVLKRPESQGGTWLLAQRMKINQVLGGVNAQRKAL